MTTTYQRTGPEFGLCGPFNGRDGQSASRWLKKFDWEMAGYVTEINTIPRTTKYLQTLDILLTENAAYWAETDSDIVTLLTEANHTQITVDQFKTRFVE